jgi:hypothetical protein
MSVLCNKSLYAAAKYARSGTLTVAHALLFLHSIRVAAHTADMECAIAWMAGLTAAATQLECVVYIILRPAYFIVAQHLTQLSRTRHSRLCAESCKY